MSKLRGKEMDLEKLEQKLSIAIENDEISESEARQVMREAEQEDQEEVLEY